MRPLTRARLASVTAFGLLAAVPRAWSDGPPETPPPALEGAPEEGRAYASGSWFGLRDTLRRHGVELGLVVQADHSANLAGGIRRGTAFRRPLAATLDVDGERLLGWKGGRLHAGFQAHDGHHGTEALVGDAQGFDNVDADRFRQVSELWIEQRLWGDRLRVKAGKVDANSEFARVEHAGEFLNSSAGFSPTIRGFPTYPDPAASVNAFADPVRWLYVGAGLYDGATHEGCHGRTGNRGFGTFWGTPSALFLVGEAGVRVSPGGRSGRIGVGAWKHTGSFESLDGTSSRSGTSGWYLLLEQRVFDEQGDRGQCLGVFAQAGMADGRLSEIDQHFSIGLSATGALPRRDRDVLGLMASTVRFSPGCQADRAGRRETAIELFYGLGLRPWLSLKPDVQYVVRPGGDKRSAVVATLRAAISF